MNAPTQHPELSDPSLTRTQKIVDSMIADIREATSAITVPKPGAWYACRDEYIRNAVRGFDTDWTRWDREASAQALAAIHAALELPAEEFKAEVRRLICLRIEAAGRAHADTCDRNGVLYDMENAR